MSVVAPLAAAAKQPPERPAFSTLEIKLSFVGPKWQPQTWRRDADSVDCAVNSLVDAQRQQLDCRFDDPQLHLKTPSLQSKAPPTVTPVGSPAPCRQADRVRG